MGKNIVKSSVFFALLGSTHKKAPCKMLMKLTPGSKSSPEENGESLVAKDKND